MADKYYWIVKRSLDISFEAQRKPYTSKTQVMEYALELSKLTSKHIYIHYGISPEDSEIVGSFDTNGKLVMKD